MNTLSIRIESEFDLDSDPFPESDEDMEAFFDWLSGEIWNDFFYSNIDVQAMTIQTIKESKMDEEDKFLEALADSARIDNAYQDGWEAARKYYMENVRAALTEWVTDEDYYARCSAKR